MTSAGTQVALSSCVRAEVVAQRPRFLVVGRCAAPGTLSWHEYLNQEKGTCWVVDTRFGNVDRTLNALARILVRMYPALIKDVNATLVGSDALGCLVELCIQVLPANVALVLEGMDDPFSFHIVKSVMCQHAGDSHHACVVITTSKTLSEEEHQHGIIVTNALENPQLPQPCEHQLSASQTLLLDLAASFSSHMDQQVTHRAWVPLEWLVPSETLQDDIHQLVSWGVLEEHVEAQTVRQAINTSYRHSDMSQQVNRQVTEFLVEHGADSHRILPRMPVYLACLTQRPDLYSKAVLAFYVQAAVWLDDWNVCQDALELVNQCIALDVSDPQQHVWRASLLVTRGHAGALQQALEELDLVTNMQDGDIYDNQEEDDDVYGVDQSVNQAVDVPIPDHVHVQALTTRGEVYQRMLEHCNARHAFEQAMMKLSQCQGVQSEARSTLIQSKIARSLIGEAHRTGDASLKQQAETYYVKSVNDLLRHNTMPRELLKLHISQLDMTTASEQTIRDALDLARDETVMGDPWIYMAYEVLMCQLTRSLVDRQQFHDAAGTLQSMIEFIQASLPSGYRYVPLAEAHRELAELYDDHLNDSLRAVDEYRSCLELYPLELAERTNILSQLGDCLHSLGRVEDAEQCFHQVLVAYRSTQHEQLSATAEKLGRVMVRQGRLMEAESLYREALSSLGRNSPSSGLFLCGAIGSLLLERGEYVQAEDVYRQLLDRIEQGHSYETPELSHNQFLAQHLFNLAGCLFQQAKFDQAELHYQQCLKLRIEDQGLNSETVKRALVNLFYCLHAAAMRERNAFKLEHSALLLFLLARLSGTLEQLKTSIRAAAAGGLT